MALAVPAGLVGWLHANGSAKKCPFLLNSSSSLITIFCSSSFGWKEITNLCIQAAKKGVEAGLPLARAAVAGWHRGSGAGLCS